MDDIHKLDLLKYILCIWSEVQVTQGQFPRACVYVCEKGIGRIKQNPKSKSSGPPHRNFCPLSGIYSQCFGARAAGGFAVQRRPVNRPFSSNQSVAVTDYTLIISLCALSLTPFLSNVV